MSGQDHEPADRPELTVLEGALRGLVPAPAALDRDALLFRAGQAAAPRRWFWPAATAVSTAAALVLAVLLACRPEPQVIEHRVYVPVERPALAPPIGPSAAPPAVAEEPSAPPQARPLGPQPAHRRLEEHLLRWGLDGLGEPSPPPANPFLSPLHLSPGAVKP